MKLPRIAIPEIDQNVTNYVNAVKAAGMEPVVVSVQSRNSVQSNHQEYLDYSEFRVFSYDGLVIPGGWDVCPSRYGQENRGCGRMMEELDDLQLSILDDFVKSRKPVLGICRGHQLINVYFGGSLIQDLPEKERHIWTEKGDNVHRCRAEAGSWLAGLYGTEFYHNSSHHQAIDVCGEGIRVVSTCPEDGVPEAMRHEKLEICGVQWHPERMCLAHTRNDTVSGLPVFGFFCEVCGGSPEKHAEKQRNVCINSIMNNRMGL